jgi:hypothetical protein
VKLNCWRLYNLATGYGQRPSDLLGLQTDLGRWSLDEACMVVGRQIQRTIEEGKDPFPQDTIKAGKFRSAKGLAKKKVKIPKSGIW